MNARPDFQTGPSRHDGNGSAAMGSSTTTNTTDQATISSLLRQLAHEVPQLVSKEAALARSEARETLTTAREGVAAVSAGGAVLMGGYIVLLLAAVYGLSNVMAPWAAALIVGAIATVAGLAMLEAGKKKFQSRSLRPDHTINSLHKDADAVRRRRTP
jgi:hypothetical protein